MKNDDKIMKLRTAINVKKNILKKCKRFTPITNCNLTLDGDRVNIHTLTNDNSIMDWMIKLNMIRLSAKDLDMLSEYKIGGYLVTEWITDLNSKLELVWKSAEEAKLKLMESKLTSLLSNEKKTEIEIMEIEEFLDTI